MFVRLIAGILSLIGFSVAIIVGLWIGNPFETILSRAWLTLVMFFILGAFAGAIVQAVIDEHRLQKMMELQQQYAEQSETENDEQNNNASNEIGQPNSATN